MSVSCVEFGSRNLVRLATFLHFRHVRTVHSHSVLQIYAWLNGRYNSIVVHRSCVVKVPKFGIGPGDNEQNANRLCRHSSADHSRLVIR